MSNRISFPAEWHEQDAILLTWPHAQTDWADQLDQVIQVYFDIAEAVLQNQNLIISCEDSELLNIAKDKLLPICKETGQSLFCFQVPADDTWSRDHGPLTVYKNGRATLLDFTFNAWGDKFSSSKDDQITSRLFDANAFPSANYENVDMILEGGSVESDGQGTLLTTSTCLLTDTRNSELNKESISKKLCTHLGSERVLWLDHGYLSGDDTDAHIDTLARFCDERTICYVKCDDEQDEHYSALQAMEQELRALHTKNGDAYRLVALPMCEAIYEGDKRLPATYANFLITNQSILLPIYHTPQDEMAVETVQSCFPGRKVIPIDCRALIKQHGSLHCVTMQLPKGVLS